jgi:hypothetical protein
MPDNQKATVKFTVDKDKLNAIKTFLELKNIDFEDEFAKYFDVIFKKYVPKNVQIYIQNSNISAS